MPKYIHVSNLPVKAEPSDLEVLCRPYGEVIGIKLKGTKAIIGMRTGLEAAAKALTGHRMGGNTLNIVVNHEEQDVLI